MKPDAEKFARRLLRWYDRNRRDLPWRPPLGGQAAPHPYHALVSELMLQQTQVCTVIPYFERFIERFPTIFALAAAKEQEVLRLWQGLGYYRRARHLHQAAKYVMANYRGEMPRTVDELLILPGIGRYTAGAIASIAFDERAPILDGNVARVLCRLDRIEADSRHAATVKQLWMRAEQILPRRRCGDFNSAMMELGATICTPKNPKCPACPVRAHCLSRAAGVEHAIPRMKRTAQSPLHKRDVLCLRRPDGRYLIEQRPPGGRWARMWQFVTIESGRRATLAKRARLDGVVLDELTEIGQIRHSLTHRRYEFRIYSARAMTRPPPAGARRKWVFVSQLSKYPLPRVHERIAGLLKNGLDTAAA